MTSGNISASLTLALLSACTSADRDSERLGAQVYEARCASCHGGHGEGDPNWRSWGPDGRLPPPPHDSTGHTWHHADGLLYRIVTLGTAGALGDSLHASRYGMPAFGALLTPREIHAVLTYIKTGWSTPQRRRQAQVSRDNPFPPAAGTR